MVFRQNGQRDQRRRRGAVFRHVWDGHGQHQLRAAQFTARTVWRDRDFPPFLRSRCHDRHRRTESAGDRQLVVPPAGLPAVPGTGIFGFSGFAVHRNSRRRHGAGLLPDLDVRSVHLYQCGRLCHGIRTHAGRTGEGRTDGQTESAYQQSAAAGRRFTSATASTSPR